MSATCSVCEWANTLLVNIAEPNTPPRHICPSCIKKALDGELADPVTGKPPTKMDKIMSEAWRVAFAWIRDDCDDSTRWRIRHMEQYGDIYIVVNNDDSDDTLVVEANEEAGVKSLWIPSDVVAAIKDPAAPVPEGGQP